MADQTDKIEKDSTPREALSPDQIVALNKPLPPEAVSQHPTKAYLSTIKAIYVVERFNQVFGLGGWYINNEFVEKVKATRIDKKTSIPYEIENVVVKSTFQAPKYGITIPDIFGGNDNEDLGDAYKGACTDALTKIGSYLGVGMDVYKGLADHKAPQKQNSSPSATKAPGDDNHSGFYCSVHDNTIILRPAGVTKQGKKYPAFYACSEKYNGGFCKEPILDTNGEVVNPNAKKELTITIDEPSFMGDEDLPR